VRPLIETHPRAAPWVAGAMTVVLMMLVNWLTEPGPITRNLPAIIGAGIGVFVAIAHLRRRIRK
jgi:hypothetical protein